MFSNVSTGRLAFQSAMWLFLAGLAIFVLYRSSEFSSALLEATKKWTTVQDESAEYRKIRFRFIAFFAIGVGLCLLMSILYAVAYLTRISGG